MSWTDQITVQVVRVIAAKSGRDPDTIEGSMNLGDPAPIGMDNPSILGMIPALNKIIKAYQPAHFITIPEISKLGMVTELVQAIKKKCSKV